MVRRQKKKITPLLIESYMRSAYSKTKDIAYTHAWWDAYIEGLRKGNVLKLIEASKLIALNNKLKQETKID